VSSFGTSTAGRDDASEGEHQASQRDDCFEDDSERDVLAALKLSTTPGKIVELDASKHDGEQEERGTRPRAAMTRWVISFSAL
jgi:hypothetical protein